MRFNTTLMGFISCVCFGVAIGIGDEINSKYRWIFGIASVLLFFISTKPVVDAKSDGELGIFKGEDDEHIALGLSVDISTNDLINRETLTVKVVNHLKGADENGKN